MSFPQKPPVAPKVKIVVPDDQGTTVAEEVELNINSQADLDRIVRSLTALLPGPKAARDVEGGVGSAARALESASSILPISIERKKLLGTALKLMSLNKLSVSHVPGAMSDPHVYSVLLALYTQENFDPQITITKLTALVGAPPTTMLRLLKSLEERGFITRKNVPEDGRKVAIRLTNHSRELLDRFFGAAQAALR